MLLRGPRLPLLMKRSTSVNQTLLGSSSFAVNVGFAPRKLVSVVCSAFQLKPCSNKTGWDRMNERVDFPICNSFNGSSNACTWRLVRYDKIFYLDSEQLFDELFVTLTKTWIILNIKKTECNNCFSIRWTKKRVTIVNGTDNLYLNV